MEAWDILKLLARCLIYPTLLILRLILSILLLISAPLLHLGQYAIQGVLWLQQSLQKFEASATRLN